MSTAQSVEPKVSVRGVWKLFGDNPPTELTPELAEKSRDELKEETGLVLGLKDISFDVLPGETFVVMGLSGSGKSTLARALIRLIEPTFGQILFDGEDILQYDDETLIKFRREKTAMVFQHFGLLPHRTVEENAAWGLEVQGVPKAERLERARETLELVGLGGWEHYRTSALSGGMRQRVGIARALVDDPSVLVMDEPFSALDPLIRREMQNELVSIQERLQKTIIFITHDLNEALKLGDRIAILRDGVVVQMGVGEDILANPADEYIEEFVRDVRKSTVITIRSLMERPPAHLWTTMSPQEAMSAIGQHGEVGGFVTDGRGRYAGCVSFASLAEASQRGDKTVRSAFREDVAPITDDLSASAALPAVRNLLTGALPVIDVDGRLVGQVTRSAVVDLIGQDEDEADTDEADTDAAGRGLGGDQWQ